MKSLGNFIFATVLGIILFSVTVSVPAVPMKTEANHEVADLIGQLAATNSDRTITSAMTRLERIYNHDPSQTSAIPALVTLLKDDRSAVRRKAARVLGVFHAPLNDFEIKLVCRQLQASDWGEVQSGVKALRDLHATSTVPELLPLLHHANSSVVRDTCRALAVLADRSVVPDLEPLLKDPRRSVAKDAQDAIVKLKAKP